MGYPAQKHTCWTQNIPKTATSSTDYLFDFLRLLGITDCPTEVEVSSQKSTCQSPNVPKSVTSATDCLCHFLCMLSIQVFATEVGVSAQKHTCQSPNVPKSATSPADCLCHLLRMLSIEVFATEVKVSSQFCGNCLRSRFLLESKTCHIARKCNRTDLARKSCTGRVFLLENAHPNSTETHPHV